MDTKSLAPQQRRRKSGMTLLEIMLVVAVLGLLAVLIVPRISGLGAAAQTNTRASQMKRINDLLEGFQMNGGTFGAAYAAGSATTNGTLRNDSLANMLTDLAAGAWAGGLQFQIPSATVTWNGATPTISGNRLQ